MMISLAPKNSDDIELDPADGSGFFQRERLPVHLVLQSQQLGEPLLKIIGIVCSRLLIR